MWGDQIGGTAARVVLAVGVVLGSLALAPARSLGAAGESTTGELESFELPSPLVETSTAGGTLADGRTSPKVNVLLPDGYDAHPDRRYPVLWLLHGGGGGTDNWLPGIADLAAGFPGIIVMPDGGGSPYPEEFGEALVGRPSAERDPRPCRTARQDGRAGSLHRSERVQVRRDNMGAVAHIPGSIIRAEASRQSIGSRACMCPMPLRHRPASGERDLWTRLSKIAGVSVPVIAQLVGMVAERSQEWASSR